MMNRAGRLRRLLAKGVLFFLCLALPGAALCQVASAGPAGLADMPLGRFDAEGSLRDVLNVVSQRADRAGALGVVWGAGESPVKISVHAEGPLTVMQVVRRICAQGGNCRVARTQDPRILNVIANDAPRAAKAVLEMRLARFDVSVDEWPDRCYNQLVDYSPMLRRQLEGVYARSPHPPPPSGYPGENLGGNVTPPHVELHLLDVTVIEVLNRIAAQYLDDAEAQRGGSAGSGAAAVMTLSRGWEMRWPSTRDLYFEVWAHSIFHGFPSFIPPG